MTKSYEFPGLRL